MTLKKQPERIRESDLFPPIAHYLIENGYTVRSEVKDCDITAIKDDELVVVELKKAFNATLLIQAAKRQRIADSVYIAIPRPKGSLFSRKWQDVCYLIRRLELGLILVALRGKDSSAEIAFHPVPFDQQKSKQLSQKKRRALITEIAGRHGDFNTGGSSRRKLMTAYKENSIQIAVYLKEYGQLSPQGLRKLGAGPKTGAILQKNYFGWFERVNRGVYRLTPQGLKCLDDYPQLVEHYRP